MVERSEVNQMAKFLMASRDLGELPPASLNEMSEMPNSNRIAPPVALATNDVAEMKAILDRFHAAAGNIVAEASYDRDLRESFAIEATPHGARFGAWDIVVQEVGKRKLYDVIHNTTGAKIASELLLYEAARSLVRHLNDGGMINAPEILELLRCEQEYAGAIHDMRLYNHHIKKAPKSPRVPIYEDRYGSAKRKAVTARDRVEKLSESF